MGRRGATRVDTLSGLGSGIAVIAPLLLSVPALAQEEAPGQALKRVEQEIQADRARQRTLDKQSEAIRKELDELRAKLVALADRTRGQETELDELEDTLKAMEEEERGQAARLDEQRAQIASLLAALQRLSRIPPEAMIARPEGPVDTLRSALLLRDTVPVLRDRAEALAAAIQRLADMRERLETQRDRIVNARTTLDERQREIARLVARREELSRQTEEDRIALARDMARLTGQAADIRQLMERIETERRATAEAAARREAERLRAEREEAERRLAEAARAKEEERREAERRVAEAKEAERKAAEQREADKRAAAERARSEAAAAQRAPEPPAAGSILGGGLKLPVGGRVVTRYGEADRFGATSRGLTISSRSGAPVLAPFAGSIMFAGPFRGYGQILIVEHSNGYHSLIAGLGRIDTSVGKQVATGEPIGLMPSPADGSPDLYFELRRHGQPINPQRGIAAPEGKGQG